MKKASKWLALLMVFAMVLFCMVGCGVGTPKATKKEEAGIVGIWKGEMKMGEATEELAETSLADLEMDFVIEFKKDGKMTAETEIDKEKLVAGTKDYMVEMLKEEGVSEKDYEAATGQSFDDLIKTTVDEMTKELLIKEEGFYKYEDGKLFTREKEEDEWEDDANFELKGDKMIITEDDAKLELHRK